MHLTALVISRWTQFIQDIELNLQDLISCTSDNFVDFFVNNKLLPSLAALG